MKILIKTAVENDYQKAFELFDLNLFKKLKPPVVTLEVERFDGCKKGDEVHLRVAGQKWVSHITDYSTNDSEIYFIDVGVIIPAPIKKWTHIHRVKKTGANQCEVIDDIEYFTGSTVLDFLIYPALMAMFSMRGPIYKRELE